jgi:hypothetical protein
LLWDAVARAARSELAVFAVAVDAKDLVGPDVGRADHLAPLLGFVGDELFEIGG